MGFTFLYSLISLNATGKIMSKFVQFEGSENGAVLVDSAPIRQHSNVLDIVEDTQFSTVIKLNEDFSRSGQVTLNIFDLEVLMNLLIGRRIADEAKREAEREREREELLAGDPMLAERCEHWDEFADSEMVAAVG